MVIKKPKWMIGDVLKIDLVDGWYSYARVLKKPLIAFYDLRINVGSEVDVQYIVSTKVIFKIWVMNNVITSGRWEIVGNVPLEVELTEQLKFFKKDQISGVISIYHGDGVETPATWAECKNLECAAVWSDIHVEDRLRDFYKGVPNRWVELLKPKEYRSPVHVRQA